MIIALLGGVLIGISASLNLYFNGRITGISGILQNIPKYNSPAFLFRLYFLCGLVSGGTLMALYQPEALTIKISLPPWRLIIAGLLVGYGTLLGSGCTSGHGVCGISRLSPRSLFATIIFILSGSLTVFLINSLEAGGFF